MQEGCKAIQGDLTIVQQIQKEEMSIARKEATVEDRDSRLGFDSRLSN